MHARTAARKHQKYCKRLLPIAHKSRVWLGLYSKRLERTSAEKAYSVFMTHQIHIQCPSHLKWFEPVLFKITKGYISKFNECWVPDFEGEKNLSGKLSHGDKLKDLKFIGPLSRFILVDEINNKDEKYKVLIICSGPEPQRSVFEKMMTEEILKTNLNSVLVRGVTENGIQTEQINNLRIISYSASEELQNLIESSGLIISRPGYSTIMDLVTLGKKAIFIPTPGQTEQEYLSENFMNRKIFYSCQQNNFTLLNALKESEKFSGIKIPVDSVLVSKTVASVLSK